MATHAITNRHLGRLLDGSILLAQASYAMLTTGTARELIHEIRMQMLELCFTICEEGTL